MDFFSFCEIKLRYFNFSAGGELVRVKFHWPAIAYCAYQFDAILFIYLFVYLFVYLYICLFIVSFLEAFEASCFEGREVPEKRKKDQFRKLVSGIVGVRIIRKYFYILLPLG